MSPIPRTVTCCPDRIDSAVERCLVYALRARGMPGPPLPGGPWDWPALFVDVWRIVEDELPIIHERGAADAAALRDAKRAARGGR